MARRWTEQEVAIIQHWIDSNPAGAMMDIADAQSISLQTGRTPGACRNKFYRMIGLPSQLLSTKRKHTIAKLRKTARESLPRLQVKIALTSAAIRQLTKELNLDMRTFQELAAALQED